METRLWKKNTNENYGKRDTDEYEEKKNNNNKKNKSEKCLKPSIMSIPIYRPILIIIL